MENTDKFLNILVNEIHTVIMATVDSEKRPVTRAIDIMLADNETFYFLTAVGKNFYSQLIDNKFISLTGVTGGESIDIHHASIHKKAISIRGSISEIGIKKLDEILKKNPYMAEIYPTEKSREALTVFKMNDGIGEFFDLSTKPITRESFKIGNAVVSSNELYFINCNCIGCSKCVDVCPQNCIITFKVPFIIDQKHCLHCGNCFKECPIGAVLRRDANV